MKRPMNRPTRRPVPRLPRGFSLIEAMIAMLITSFGLLALAGIGLKLAFNEDVARQRGEATRLAQEKIEELRSFSQISAAAGVVTWDGLTGANDVVTEGSVHNGESYHSNTRFERRWELLDTAGDPWRRVRVTVAWADRVNGESDKQTLTFNTILSKTDPFDSGALAFPLPGNTTLKRPKNRNLNIPVPAVDLGNGQSVVQITSTFAVVFSNDSGYVVLTCNKTITTVEDLQTGCTQSNAYIIAGYISLSGTSSFPTGLLLSTAEISGSTGVTCSLANALDQNDGTAIAGYKYYLCVISVPSEGAAWGGTVRLGGLGLSAGPTNYLVCRFQYAAAGSSPSKANNPKNVQPYTEVAESLDNQNYVITTATACPTITSLATTLHQNCRSSNPNGNAVNRPLDCPVL